MNIYNLIITIFIRYIALDIIHILYNKQSIDFLEIKLHIKCLIN